MSASTVHLAYGRAAITLDLDPALARWHVIAPRHEQALVDPREALSAACASPIAHVPLLESIRPSDRVVMVTSDGTRPVPNRVVIPWLLDALPVPPERVTVLLGTGTHRPNTYEEIVSMFGEETAGRVRILNHNAYDPEDNVCVGMTPEGAPVAFNRHYVEADKRIAVGFIEPHFFAGFSGGPKAVAPGMASIESILHLHTYDLIAHPKSTWGVLEGNPLQSTIRNMVACCPPDFLINVTLNAGKAVTGVFTGDYIEAHRAGCARVREQAMVAVPHTFPIVVTSNSGYPLDQNVYQSVKGMSAAAQIVQPGGDVFLASECSDGIPEHGQFGTMLREHPSLEALDAHLRCLPAPVLDQWQVQVLLRVRTRCAVRLLSSLDAATVRTCKLIPVDDMQRDLEQRIRELGSGAPVAVLPEGPLTIPYTG
jgi:lactate racemase